MKDLVNLGGSMLFRFYSLDGPDNLVLGIHSGAGSAVAYTITESGFCGTKPVFPVNGGHPARHALLKNLGPRQHWLGATRRKCEKLYLLIRLHTIVQPLE